MLETAATGADSPITSLEALPPKRCNPTTFSDSTLLNSGAEVDADAPCWRGVRKTQVQCANSQVNSRSAANSAKEGKRKPPPGREIKGIDNCNQTIRMVFQLVAQQKQGAQGEVIKRPAG